MKKFDFSGGSTPSSEMLNCWIGAQWACEWIRDNRNIEKASLTEIISVIQKSWSLASQLNCFKHTIISKETVECSMDMKMLKCFIG
jgi:hypothetical protein